MPETAAIWSTFIAKYDICGNYVWAGSINTDYKIGASSICVHPRDGYTTDVYIAGNFWGTVDFDTGLNTFRMTSSRNKFDWYLMKMNFSDTPRNLTYLKTSSCKNYQLNEVLYTASGLYQQVIPLVGGCDSIIMLDLTIIPMEEPVITIDNFLLSLTQNFSNYQWFKDGEPVSGATQGTYRLMGNGDYWVVVGNSNGCVDTSEIYIVNNYTSTGINLLTPNNLQVYPNPAEDKIYINSVELLNVRLTDMEGRIVLDRSAVKIVSVAHLSEGMYLLYIMDKAYRLLKAEKFIKSR